MEIFFRCKLDETLEYHAPGVNSQRMSFEAFTFVGAEDSVAYLQCDVVICDANDPNSRCNAGCLPSARRRRAPVIISTHNKASGNIRSGPMLVTHKKLRRPRRQVQISNSNLAVVKTQLTPRAISKSGLYFKSFKVPLKCKIEIYLWLTILEKCMLRQILAYFSGKILA